MAWEDLMVWGDPEAWENPEIRLPKNLQTIDIFEM